MILTLKSLLQFGDVSPLYSSMSPYEAHLAIGASDGQCQFGNILIEKHGPFQLEYKADKLMALNWIISDSDQSQNTVAGKQLSSKITIEEFLNYCDKIEAPWQIDQKLSFDRQLIIRTCKSVIVIFDLDHRELQRISVELS